MFGGDIWSAADWITGGRTILNYEMRPADYAAIIAVCSILGIALSIKLLNTARNMLTARGRFYNLRTEILDLIKERDRAGEEGKYELYARSGDLMQKLKRLGIPYPVPPIDRPDPWWFWLPRLYTFASHRDIESARADRVVWVRYAAIDEAKREAKRDA